MAVNLTYLQSTDNSWLGSANSQSVSANLGAAAVDRLILCGASVEAGGANTMTGATIGGIAATLIGSINQGGVVVGLFLARVPTGTSGNVVITHGSVITQPGRFSLWRITGANLAISDSDGTGATSGGVSLNTVTIPSGGDGAWVWANVTATATTWSATVTERDDATPTSAAYRHSVADSPIPNTTPNVTSTGASANQAIFGVSFAQSQSAIASLVDDSADTFFVPAVIAPAILTAALFDDSTDTFFTPTESMGLTAGLYTDGDTFYDPLVPAALGGTYFGSRYFGGRYFGANYWGSSVIPGGLLLSNLVVDLPDTFFTPTITVGAVTLTAGLYSDPDTFFVPLVAGGVFLSPGLYSDPDTFFAATLTSLTTLTAGRYDDPDIFFAPSSGPVVYPALYSDADNIFAAALVVHYILTANLYSDPDTFFTATIAQGAASLLAGRVDDTPDTFFSPGIVNAGNLAAGFYIDPTTIFATNVFADHQVNGQFLSDTPDTFFSPTLVSTSQVSAGLYSDPDTLFATRVASVMNAGLVSDPDTFFVPSIAQPGFLIPLRFDDPDTFFVPSILTAVQGVFPPRLDDPDTIFSATVFYGRWIDQAEDVEIWVEQAEDIEVWSDAA